MRSVGEVQEHHVLSRTAFKHLPVDFIRFSIYEASLVIERFRYNARKQFSLTSWSFSFGAEAIEAYVGQPWLVSRFRLVCRIEWKLGGRHYREP